MGVPGSAGSRDGAGSGDDRAGGRGRPTVSNATGRWCPELEGVRTLRLVGGVQIASFL